MSSSSSPPPQKKVPTKQKSPLPPVRRIGPKSMPPFNAALDTSLDKAMKKLVDSVYGGSVTLTQKVWTEVDSIRQTLALEDKTTSSESSEAKDTPMSSSSSPPPPKKAPTKKKSPPPPVRRIGPKSMRPFNAALDISLDKEEDETTSSESSKSEAKDTPMSSSSSPPPPPPPPKKALTKKKSPPPPVRRIGPKSMRPFNAALDISLDKDETTSSESSESEAKDTPTKQKSLPPPVRRIAPKSMIPFNAAPRRLIDYHCAFCRAVFNRVYNLKSHTLFIHLQKSIVQRNPTLLQKPFACPECNRPSRIKSKALEHYALSHNKIYDYCSFAQLNGMEPFSGSAALAKTPSSKPKSKKVTGVVSSSALINTSSDSSDDDKDNSGSGGKSHDTSTKTTNPIPVPPAPLSKPATEMRFSDSDSDSDVIFVRDDKDNGGSGGKSPDRTTKTTNPIPVPPVPLSDSDVIIVKTIKKIVNTTSFDDLFKDDKKDETTPKKTSDQATQTTPKNKEEDKTSEKK